MFTTKPAVITATDDLRPIVVCPRCLSNEAARVKPLPNTRFRDAAEIAWNEFRAGQHPAAAQRVFRWVCISAANAAAYDNYACGHCRLSFRVREGQS